MESDVVAQLIDRFIVFNAISSLAVYIFFHVVAFRFSQSTHVLDWLVKIFFLVAGFNLTSSCYFLLEAGMIGYYGIVTMTVGVVLSFILCGMLCFCYVICILGPYEASVRLRIIREVYEKGPHGITLEGLLHHYNEHVLLKLRLERLLASKEISFDGKVYSYGNSKSVFMFITRLSAWLRQLYSMKSEDGKDNS